MNELQTLAARFITQNDMNSCSPMPYSEFHDFAAANGFGFSEDESKENGIKRQEFGEAIHQLQRIARAPETKDELPVVRLLRMRRVVKENERMPLTDIIASLSDLVEGLKRAKDIIDNGGFRGFDGVWYQSDTRTSDEHDQVANAGAESAYNAVLHADDGVDHTYEIGCHYDRENREIGMKDGTEYVCPKCIRYGAAYAFIERIEQQIADVLK